MSAMRTLFPLGQVVATPGALAVMGKEGINPLTLLRRHISGDWGDLDEDDKQANERAVEDKSRILSAYGESDTKLWIITEADRSVTTILRPDEY